MVRLNNFLYAVYAIVERLKLEKYRNYFTPGLH